MMQGSATAYTYSKSAQCLKHNTRCYPSITYIADCRTNTSDCINGRSVQAGKVVCKGIRDIEGPPISLSWRTVDEEHDAKRDRVRDGKAYGEPYEPCPTLRICSVNQAAAMGQVSIVFQVTTWITPFSHVLEKENRHFCASSAD